MLKTKHGALFIHIPRTGGTTIRNCFQERRQRYREFHWHSPALQGRKLDDTFDKTFSFAVVRNPFDWLTSFYYASYTDKYDSFKQFLFKEKKPISAVTFKYIEGHHFNRTPFIEVTQSFYYNDLENQQIVTKIFKFEELIKSNYKDLYEHTGKKLSSTSKWNHSVKRPGFNLIPDKKQYMSLYDQESIDYVYKYHSDVILRFGYEP